MPRNHKQLIYRPLEILFLPFRSILRRLFTRLLQFFPRSQIIADRETGRSRGFGFIEMSEGGDEAITQLNGAQFQGRCLTVNEAKPREARTPSSYPSAPRSNSYNTGSYSSERARY